MDPSAILNHEFTVAAYVITWAIQLGYLAWRRPLRPRSALAPNFQQASFPSVS
jgi:hypothetical protein